ncbi:MAG: glutathione S-transferase domain-containing protein [Actinobacteria bacterium]|nr:glutathione S-transferase domain-containing protein [Actinomycetota bacterium]
MKLYVCYGKFPMGPHEHPCRTAWEALRDAGYEPEVKLTYGLGILPNAFNFTRGRREVRRLSPNGTNWVPLMEADDGTVVQGSKKIIAWAAENPVGGGMASQ